jgi:hypothetical protein
MLIEMVIVLRWMTSSRGDGYPYSNQLQPNGKGVAAYLSYQRRHCDRRVVQTRRSVVTQLDWCQIANALTEANVNRKLACEK